MRTNIIRSAIVIVASTILLGFVYPAGMVAVGQIAFSNQANGSLITRDGRTGGSKLGANSKALAALVKTRIQKIMALEGPYNPGLPARDIPVDAVTASGSGID